MIDIEIRLGFYADDLNRAEETWKAIQEIIDWGDGIAPYACEAEVLGENGGDLDSILKRTPGEVMERLKGIAED